MAALRTSSGWDDARELMLDCRSSSLDSVAGACEAGCNGFAGALALRDGCNLSRTIGGATERSGAGAAAAALAPVEVRLDCGLSCPRHFFSSHSTHRLRPGVTGKPQASHFRRVLKVAGTCACSALLEGGLAIGSSAMDQSSGRFRLLGAGSALAGSCKTSGAVVLSDEGWLAPSAAMGASLDT